MRHARGRLRRLGAGLEGPARRVRFLGLLTLRAEILPAIMFCLVRVTSLPFSRRCYFASEESVCCLGPAKIAVALGDDRGRSRVVGKSTRRRR